MGSPKQMIRHRGISLVETAVNALAGHLEEMVIAGSAPVPDAIRDMVMLEDIPDVKGPMAGILAAMQFQPNHAWLVAACDMPYISAEAVGWVLDQRSEDFLAVLPRVSPHRVEPLLAIYEPSIRPLLEKRAAAGWWGIRHLQDGDRIFCPEVPPEIARSWVNVNTLEQIQKIPGLDV